MANIFLRKTSREIGANLTIVGNYTVPANVGAVVVGLCLSNITTDDIEANVAIDNGISSYYIVNNAPITDGSSLVVAGKDQKIILQTGDSVKINSSAANSIDVVMSIMETDGVGITSDPVTYSITSNRSSVTEGNVVGFTVSTSNVPNDTVLYWTTVGNVSSADFSDSVTSGNITIANGSASITRTLIDDSTTEGVEYFDLALRTGSISGTIVATSGNVTVVDPTITAITFSGTLVATNFTMFGGTKPWAAFAVGDVESWVQADENYFAFSSGGTDFFYPTPYGNYPWASMISDGTTAMAIGGTTGNVVITTDGVDWTIAGSIGSATGGAWWWQSAVGSGTWVTIPGVYGSSNQVAYSTNNGSTWTVITPLPSASWRDIEYGNGIFLVIGSLSASPFTQYTYTSPDGINWTAKSATNGGKIIYALSKWWVFNIEYGAGQIGVQYSSNDGTSWTTATPSVANITSASGGSIAFGNGVFVIVKSTVGSVWTSTDGLTWVEHTNKFVNPSVNMGSPRIAFVNGIFVIVTTEAVFDGEYVYKGNFFSSTDGINWNTTVNLPDYAPSGFSGYSAVVGLN